MNPTTRLNKPITIYNNEIYKFTDMDENIFKNFKKFKINITDKKTKYVVLIRR